MSGLTQDLDADGLREIGEQVHALYSRGPFGRVLKTEIDGVLFRAYARHQHRLKRRPEEFAVPSSWCVECELNIKARLISQTVLPTCQSRYEKHRK